MTIFVIAMMDLMNLEPMLVPEYQTVSFSVRTGILATVVTIFRLTVSTMGFAIAVMEAMRIY